MIKSFFIWAFTDDIDKQNTMMIYGKTSSGKSKYLDRVKIILPQEEYVQQHRTHFDCDYKKKATYDHTMFKPVFVTINEGA